MNLTGNDKYVQAKYKINAGLMGKSLVELYSPDNELGRWLRTKNIIEKIGDMLFVHAGISRRVNQLSWTIDDINKIARPYYDVREASKSSDSLLNALFNDDTSPLWYRAYYKRSGESEVIMAKIIDSTLEKFGVNRIITGHTIVADTISVHYGGKVINTDTKHAEGKSEALLIEGDHFYRVNDKAERKLLFVDDRKKVTTLIMTNSP